MELPHQIEPIAFIRSGFKERFGLPRQSGLASAHKAQIVFRNNEYNRMLLRGIEDFSHYWVTFGFHALKKIPDSPLVAPPRFAGKAKVGALASRSPYRPNRLGQSLVELESISNQKTTIWLHISGCDILHGTPVFDLKPYVPYCDSAPTATAKWAKPPQRYVVEWTQESLQALGQLGAQKLRDAIEQTLALDPRPGHEREKDGKPGQTWSFCYEQLDISWKVEKSTAIIIKICNKVPSKANNR